MKTTLKPGTATKGIKTYGTRTTSKTIKPMKTIRNPNPIEAIKNPGQTQQTIF